MTDEQLLEQYYNEEWREGMPPFEQITDEYKNAILESLHFAAYRFNFRVVEFWQALERKAMMDDIKQNNSKK